MTVQLPLLLLLACGGGPERRPAEKNPPSSTTEDSATPAGSPTGTYTLPAACPREPCVHALASAHYEGASETFAGASMAISGDLVFVGSPLKVGPVGYPPLPSVRVLQGSNLVEVGSWVHGEYGSYFGTSMDAKDIDGDGEVELLVGAPAAAPDGEHRGSVFLLRGTPASEAPVVPNAVLRFDAPYLERVGFDVQFTEGLGPEPGVEILVGGLGNDFGAHEGALYALDPSLVGRAEADDARRRIGGLRVGLSFETHDLDLDGQLDVVTTLTDEAHAGWFLGPWVSDLEIADADGIWNSQDPDGDLGFGLRSVGDLTGDGAADLILPASLYSGVQERAGRAWIVPGGQPSSGPVEDLAYAFEGDWVGSRLGNQAVTADVDQDGAVDLILAASGVYPGEDVGRVLVFNGPLAPGARTPSDADHVVYGPYAGDAFGSSLQLGDPDEDGSVDLLVGAKAWPAGLGSGAVFQMPLTAIDASP